MSTGKWPKTRPAMSEAVKKIYEDNYVSNRAGAGLINNITMYLEQWMHRQIAERQNSSDSVLEIGAGNLNHAPYLECLAWDVVEPYNPLYEDGAEFHHMVRRRYTDISETPENIYDRVISIAVMEHICDLPTLLRKSNLALKSGGRFQAAIPSEGGLLWRLMSWHIKGFFFRRKYGQDYKEIMRWEHVNNADEIIDEIRKEFGYVRVVRFPKVGRNLSLYTYVEALKK